MGDVDCDTAIEKGGGEGAAAAARGGGRGVAVVGNCGYWRYWSIDYWKTRMIPGVGERVYT